MRQRVEPVEGDLVAALVAAAERLRRPIESSQRFVDMPEEAPFLAGEEEGLFALHRVRPLVGHVERIRVLAVALEGLVVVPEFLEHPMAFLEQPLLEVRELLLGH